MATIETANNATTLSSQEYDKPRSLWSDALRQFLRHPTGMVGAVIVFILIFTGLFGPMLAPMDPNDPEFNDRFAPPSLTHPMGADDFGRDILSRVMHGASVSLRVAAISVSLATVVGTLLGMVAGYGNRVTDEVIMRSMDVLFAFPAILLAIAVLAALGKGVSNAMIAIGIVYIPIFARIARAEVISIKEEEFITVARALGATPMRIMFVHILPNILSPIIVEISLSLSFAILAEAALSFFGLSVQPPDPSWGRMLAEGRAYFQQSTWLGVFPGLAIMISVMGFNFLGDGLRDSLDPQLRKG
jgi:peptide/nickel transport system permease protein